MAILRSLTYPLTVVNGGLQLSEDFDVMRERILQVLETQPFERVMQALYGTPDFVFNAYPSASIVAERVQIALEAQIPAIEFGIEASINEEGAGTLTINWSLNNVPQPPIQYRLKA